MKRAQSSAVSTAKIDQFYDECIKVGASGGKVLGAGGGGHLLICAKPELKPKIVANANRFGFVQIPFLLDELGAVAWTTNAQTTGV